MDRFSQEDAEGAEGWFLCLLRELLYGETSDPGSVFTEDNEGRQGPALLLSGLPSGEKEFRLRA